MKTQGKYGVTAQSTATILCEDVRNFSTRRRNMLYLMHRYLLENGYYSSAEALKNEGRLSDDFELCDNVDLDAIYLEYASFFNMKFGKYPRILKKMSAKIKVERTTGAATAATLTATVASTTAKDTSNKTNKDSSSLANWHVGVGAAASQINNSMEHQQSNQLKLHIKKLETTTTTTEQQQPSHYSGMSEIEHGAHATDDALFCSMDWQVLGELVKTTILREPINLRWSDICGNHRAIELIKEAVLTPIDYPQLFAHGLRPWRSLLLHGPPGSGKTLLAKVLYAETQSRVTFFNITASVMVSKWRGESEKILRVLFHMAARRTPAVIFFDEIEGLTSKRDRATDHESSKRFKNELLQLLDGMEHNTLGHGVFVLASTNLPWDIDEAFLRRFEKKILIQLPNALERSNLIQRLLGASNVSLNQHLLDQLVALSDQYTGDEIRLACKEISMQRVRCATRPSPAGGAVPKETQAIVEANLERAFKQVHPLGQKLLAKHEQWQQENGS
ncbi:uncharacterized protein Dwil_GK10264 [Drosophila willistoni]|uniref:AAA+ ATPase domain-containing protein n=1 Tax=Drosophila willistoni TaxID=7260 RepID=B4MJA9_DROWI|nr:katanin p60 ATPase-containing subunit A-like 2 [Drosophila willistoni]EDW72198.1 uncharacterized protein Dwil_GK10264 [Drosophila willistoni]